MNAISSTPLQISRALARTRGLLRYFTGKPCKYGHIAEQWTRNGECVECARARARKNVKRWHKEFAERDPEGHRAYNAERARKEYAKNPLPRKAAAKRYAQKHPEKVAERMRRWRDKNWAHIQAYEADRYRY